jgi:hypothetical protein
MIEPVHGRGHALYIDFNRRCYKKLSEPKGTPGKRESHEKYSIYLIFPSYSISLRFSLVFVNLLNDRRYSICNTKSYFVKLQNMKVASFFEATIGAKANSNRRMHKFLADELP